MTITMPPEIPPLDRFELYGYFGYHRVLEPATEEYMRAVNERELRGDDVARGEWWHTSFHASEFPGDDIDGCARFLTYKRMNFPPTEALPPWVTTTGTIGKAGELDIARAWYEAGHALAVPENMDEGEHQLVFAWPEYWLTGSVDLPILRPGDDKPHIVEIKCKADEVIEEMKVGVRKWDIKHRFQLLTSIGLANQHDWGTVVVCKHTWHILQADILKTEKNPDGVGFGSDAMSYCPRCGDYSGCQTQITLRPPDTGSIYYWSRSWPRNTVEFYFRHDEAFINAGLEIIKEAKDNFERDKVPARPAHFMWSMGSCARCTFKPFCRLDEGILPRKRKVTEKPAEKLTESHGVKHAEAIRGHYDPDASRQRVLKRWNG